MTGKVSSSEHSFKILNLFRTLSSWGSSNYRPSAPFLYEVASHVKNFHSGHYYYLAQLTPARVGIARSGHVQLGASPHVII